MFHPNLGRWMQLDPIGFEGGDSNLYRGIENNPVNTLDPMGTEVITIEPRIIEEGIGQPPDYRQMVAPTVIRNGTPYFNNQKQWDQVRFGTRKAITVLFRNQKSTTDAGVVTENVEVRAWGTRRFPKGKVNDSGDHIAWVVVQMRFLKGTCADAKGAVVRLPDRWKRIGFSLNYGIFLRGVAPALPSFSESPRMNVQKDDTSSIFVDRFIGGAQALRK